jgi:uncharacterized LabA/DUF88 family protein
MASSPDNISMAVFCDFENVALGVRDANYEKFDIKPILERLLLKGSIVVKKAYCDWDRYKGFKATMHEANFELIEIPHVRQSGKNSADIRLVVDALDLCYTKSHVNTFVIISGDSDFSPLVSKLRENAKQVIGVGVKQSTSDLLVANCDEFIFYDDLVREVRRAAAKRDERKAPAAPKRTSPPDEGNRRKEELEARKAQAIELVVEMFDALVSERGDSGKIWASLLKDTLKRRRPDFNEAYFGFRTFGNLLEEAQARGMLEFGRDEKSGAYVYRSSNPPLLNLVPSEPAVHAPLESDDAEAPEAKSDARRRGRGGRNQPEARAESVHEMDDEAQAEPQERTERTERTPRARPEPRVQPESQAWKEPAPWIEPATQSEPAAQFDPAAQFEPAAAHAQPAESPELNAIEPAPAARRPSRGRKPAARKGASAGELPATTTPLTTEASAPSAATMAPPSAPPTTAPTAAPTPASAPVEANARLETHAPSEAAASAESDAAAAAAKPARKPVVRNRRPVKPKTASAKPTASTAGKQPRSAKPKVTPDKA